MYRLFVALIFLPICFFASANEKELVACIDDHPPYQYLGDPPYGTHVAALFILADVLDRELAFIQSPNFARCVALLRAGYVDVIAGLNKTEERGNFAFYAPFKLADKLTVITREGITVNTYEDFKGKIIGIPRGSSYFYKFDNDKTLNKVSIQSERVGLSLIVKERIDLILASPGVLSLHVKDITKNELAMSAIELDQHRSKVTYFGFSKKNTLQLSEQEITAAVKEAFENGVFKPSLAQSNSAKVAEKN